DHPSTLTEAEFLDRELCRVRRMMRAEAEGVRQGLRQAADLKSWGRHYPWYSVGVAAVAGLALSRAIPRRSARKSRERQETRVEQDAAERRAAPQKPLVASLLGSILASLFKAAAAVARTW